MVTDRDLCKHKSLENVIMDAIKGGVCMVQLREKNLTTREFIKEGLRIKKLLAPHQIPLIINDRVDVALSIKADGVHIGQNDIPYSNAREILGPNALIGLTVENVSQIKETQNYDLAYIAFSSIFPTPTKTDTIHYWGLEGLKQGKSISRHPVVAIGGINSNNAESVFNAGADCIAVVSAICSAPNPYQATRNLVEIYKNQLI